ncbi:MAG: DUF6391 domain-containing protein [Chloroflexi bacterium]|nr:DUF6391 domain-containing protein [Chloroflexota bacterium]
MLPTLLNSSRLLRVRRNHGLEHASIHILTEKNPRRAIAGHSDSRGFWLFGELNLDEVRAAVEEALQRLRAGEHRLAVHPNCGTNLVVSGAAAGIFGALSMTGAGSKRTALLERLPLAILLSTVALVVARPLGMRLQEKITTSGDPGHLEILEIRQSRRGNLILHRVETRSQEK